MSIKTLAPILEALSHKKSKNISSFQLLTLCEYVHTAPRYCQSEKGVAKSENFHITNFGLHMVKKGPVFNPPNGDHHAGQCHTLYCVVCVFSSNKFYIFPFSLLIYL